MGNLPSAAKSTLTLLEYVLKSWDSFDPQPLKKKHLIFFCSQACSEYKLDREKWSPEGNINYNTILQLALFCRREGKWSEVPYV